MQSVVPIEHFLVSLTSFGPSYIHSSLASIVGFFHVLVWAWKKQYGNNCQDFVDRHNKFRPGTIVE